MSNDENVDGLQKRQLEAWENAKARSKRQLESYAKGARDEFYESREWQMVRYRALKRSAGVCQCCGHRGDALSPLHVDHIKPRSKYPKLALSLENLQVLCRECNLGKSNKDETDWRLMPSKELAVLNWLDTAQRFRLQQLGWLRINGHDKQIRHEAQKEYRRLWREHEARWLESRKAAP